MCVSRNTFKKNRIGRSGSLNSSQINACVVGIEVLGPRFIVSSEGLGLHNILPLRGFEPSTSRMPGKHCTTMLQLPPRVGGSELGLVGFGETHIIFFGLRVRDISA